MSLKRKIDLAFASAILVLALIALNTYRSTIKSRQSDAMVTHTQDVLALINETLKLSVDLETGQRGYIITGKDNFLEPLDNARHKVFMSMDTLKARVIDNPSQVARAIQIRRLIEHKLRIVDSAVELRKSGDSIRAFMYVAQGTGKKTMDSIRVIGKEMENEELDLLNNRSKTSSMSAGITNQSFLILVLLIFLLASIAYYIIARNTSQLLSLQALQKQMISELNDQNRNLDDFAHLISHNVRSPAANIATLITFVDEKSSIDDYKNIFEKIRTVSRNLTETLSELLEILSIKKDKGIKKTLLRFGDVLVRVQSSLEGEVIASKAIITSNFIDAPTIEYPKSYLESILHNLLSNAIKYRHQEREPVIKITSNRENGRIKLRIEDNGIGIDLDRYGDKLFGLRQTFHDHPDSKGVGLYMTKTQIETLGGTISVRSEGGLGTTFVIQF